MTCEIKPSNHFGRYFEITNEKSVVALREPRRGHRVVEEPQGCAGGDARGVLRAGGRTRLAIDGRRAGGEGSVTVSESTYRVVFAMEVSHALIGIALAVLYG